MKTTLLVLAALGAGFVASPVTAPAADVRANWDNHCAKCHAADGSGNTKMGRKLSIRDYRDPKVQAALTDRDMIKATRGGLRDQQRELMKPFGGVLSDDEIKSLIAHIRSMAPAQ